VQTNGPYGGDVRCFAVSGRNIFAGTYGGGVFLSTNNGTSWTQVNNGLTNTVVLSLAVSGTNIFAGTYGGVFLSMNNGASWTQVNNGLTNTWVRAIAVSGTNIFAGTSGGVFLSTNNGTSWTQVNNGLTNTNVRSLAVSGTNIFAATYGGGVFLSTNNGTSWTQVNNGLTNTWVYALTVSGTNIFAGTEGGGVFLSTNNGTSWTQVNNGLTNTTVYALAVSGTNIFAGTDGGVFISTNNGASWTQVNNGLTDTDVEALAVSGTNIFAGTDGGVFLSTNNGTSWTEVNNGLTNTYVRSLAVSGTNIFAGTDGGVFLSTNNGTTWTQTGLTNTAVLSLAVSGTNIFAGTGGGVFLSTNNGTSWTQVNNGLTNTAVLSLAVSGSNIFAGTYYGGVFLSTNNGTSWTQTGLTNTDVWSLAVSGTNIFAGTNGGVFLSTNNGTSWTQTGLTNTYVWSLAASGTNIFAGTNGGVFLSTNNGTSWTQVNNGLTNTIVTSLAVSGTNIFAGTGGGGVWRMPLSTFIYPSTIQLYQQFIPPGSSDKSNYRMIGLPGSIDIPVSKVLSGNEGTDWEVYTDNGAAQNYQVKYDGSSTFHFSPGRAFWIFAKKPFSISQTAPTVPLDNSYSYPIPLHVGWNLISNPFEKSIPWSAVQALNGITQPIYSFNGSYSTATSFDPYTGYYFYNDRNLPSVRIPYVFSASTAHKGGSWPQNVSSVQNNLVKLSLSCEHAEPLSVTVGFDPSVSDTVNKLNIFAPPDDFSNVDMQIIDENVDGYWKRLFSDFRNQIGNGQSFDLEVKNLTGKGATLKPMLAGGFENYSVYLVDKGMHILYDLKKTDSIVISGAYKYKSYEILIGGKSFIDSVGALYEPKSFQLFQNYPNPFNPVTIIRFEIPKAEHVSLTVYDVMGRRVETLINANLSPGYYEVPFDGSKLASGIYFFRLSAGSFVDTKKGVLVK